MGASLETLYIEATNQCNIACSSCPRTFFHARDQQGDLSLTRVEAILNQIPDGLRIVLHGLGEPLQHPQIADIVVLAKSHDHYVLFNSNATLLSPLVATALIEANLDELRISIDSPDPETYRKIRPAAELSGVIQNVRCLLEKRERSKKSTPRVSFWMTAVKSRIHSLPDMLRLASDTGVDEVYLQRLVFFHRGYAVEEESIFRNADNSTIAVLQEAEQVAKEVGVRLWGAGDNSPILKIMNDDDNSVRPWSACRRPFKNAYVTVNGNLLPCCIAPFSSGPNIDQHVLGNIFQDSFEEIWNGQRYKEFRQAFQSDEPWECCSHCGLDWSL